MARGYEMVSAGVNRFLQFYSGYLEGKSIREKEREQGEIRKLIETAIQAGTMQPSFTVGPEGKMTTRFAPTRPPTPPTPGTYASPEQRRMRMTYGLEQPTTEELAPYAPEAIPITEGGYVMPGPAGYEGTIERRPELAPEFFEREFAEPTRRRYEKAGFEPEIKGFKRKKEEAAKPTGIKTEAEKKQTKATLFREYTLSLAPKLNIQSYVDKYDKQAPTQILKTLRKSNTDFLRWIESTYGEDLARRLFPEQYLQKR